MPLLILFLRLFLMPFPNFQPTCPFSLLESLWTISVYLVNRSWMVPLPQYEPRDNSCSVKRNLSFEFQFYHLFTRSYICISVKWRKASFSPRLLRIMWGSVTASVLFKKSLSFKSTRKAFHPLRKSWRGSLLDMFSFGHRDLCGCRENANGD